MLNNEKLVRRLKNIFKYLKDYWGITPYRIAVESGIPHSSLKYMNDGKFEWKLNHMLSIIDFLNRNGVTISLEELLDFDNKKSISEYINTDKADFRQILYKDYPELVRKDVPEIKEEPINLKKESEILEGELLDVLKEYSLSTKNKISLDLKINGNGYKYQKSLKVESGRKLKK